jgi:ABC-type phosphate transport system substrate-binding protein
MTTHNQDGEMPHLTSLTAHHRRLPRAALAAGALTLAAALAACTGTTTRAPQPPAAGTADLTGAGSTFDAPFFGLAFPAYQQAHPSTAGS